VGMRMTAKLNRARRNWFAVGAATVIAAAMAAPACALEFAAANCAHSGLCLRDVLAASDRVAQQNGAGMTGRDDAKSDPLGNDPLVLMALERRCPDVFSDPSWYDDDIIALCLLARNRNSQHH
jgi:hypothetical protein